MKNFDLYENSISSSKQYLSFEQVQKLWSAQNRIKQKPATQHRYDYLLQRHILPELGSYHIDSLTAPMINEFLLQKKYHGKLDGSGGLSASYVRSIALLIHAVMDFAAQSQFCTPMCSKIHKPPAERKELPILGFRELKNLIASVSDHPNSIKVAISLALFAGLRLGEICALHWNDIDMNEQVLHIRHTVSRVSAASSDPTHTVLILDKPKTATSLRCVPICPQLYEVLSHYRQHVKSEYVVSGKPGFVSPRTLEYRFRIFLEKANIPYIHFHSLRHTFATRCIESGVDIKSLSEILGHANVSITLTTYVHSSMEMKRKELEKLSF